MPSAFIATSQLLCWKASIRPCSDPSACADLKLLTVERMCGVDNLNYWWQSFGYDPRPARGSALGPPRP
jgi:hypothetical protein